MATTMHLTNETVLAGDWTKGPAGTNNTMWVYMAVPSVDKVIGAIAESWEMPDANTFVYHIRKGVRFALNPNSEASRLVNGREINADDVAYSLNRNWESPLSIQSTGAPRGSTIESITATDKWTVVVKTVPGRAGLAFRYAGLYGFIIPREVVTKYGNLADWKNSVGTGPHMLVDYIEGSSATFKRNPNYWDKDPLNPANQLPYVESVKWFFITDDSTRVAALRTSKIDMLGGRWGTVPFEDAQQLLKTKPDLKYIKYTGDVPAAIFMRQNNPTLPFKDLRVRRALAMGINNKEIADTFYSGQATILAWPVMPIPDHAEMYTPLDKLPESTRELYEYHPDKAKQLLAEAGYPNGFKTEIVAVQSGVDLLSIVKAYWAKIGVDLEIQVKEPATFNSLVRGDKHKELCLSGLSPAAWEQFSETVNWHVQNYGRVDDAKINEAEKFMYANYFDEAARKKMMKELVPYMLSQAFLLQLPVQDVYHIWQPWVKNYHGEIEIGYAYHMYNYTKYIWIDQSLKQKMTGEK